MTGTERSWLRTVLGMLRTSALENPPGRVGNYKAASRARGIIEYAAGLLHDSAPIGVAILSAPVSHAFARGVTPRVLRAKLCLYLRAVLRAEALGWDWIELGGAVFPDEEMSGEDLGECRRNEGLEPSWRVGKRWESARSAAPYRLARPLWVTP